MGTPAIKIFEFADDGRFIRARRVGEVLAQLARGLRLRRLEPEGGLAAVLDPREPFPDVSSFLCYAATAENGWEVRVDALRPGRYAQPVASASRSICHGALIGGPLFFEGIVCFYSVLAADSGR